MSSSKKKKSWKEGVKSATIPSQVNRRTAKGNNSGQFKNDHKTETMTNLVETRLEIITHTEIHAVTVKPPLDLTEKVKELVRLAQEQGYLTYGDINDALPEGVV